MVGAIEFFSGIGGWHAALNGATEKVRQHVQIRHAFDVNLVANAVYEYNFDQKPQPASLERIEANRIAEPVWFLSPPCQPHTSAGKGLDVDDARSKPLAHITELVPQLLPRFVLLENVPPFQNSMACRLLISHLEQVGLNVLQFQLNSVDFGTPNERKRYFLVAREKPFSPTATTHVLPDGELTYIPGSSFFKTEGTPLNLWRPISEFLDPPNLCGSASRTVTDLNPSRTLLRRSDFLFDVVTTESTRCSLFTKGYGKHVCAGPLLDKRSEELHWSKDAAVSTTHPSNRYTHVDSQADVRLFSSREIIRLMGFPSSFEFPPDVTEEQRRRLLGNSLNVTVATELLNFVFAEIP